MNMRIEASDIGVVNLSSTGSAPLPRDLETCYFECCSNPVKSFDCVCNHDHDLPK